MASVRDVLDHAGQPATLERAGVAIGRALATLHGSRMLLEPKIEPQMGDRVAFKGGHYLVETVAAELHEGRIDHYRLGVAPATGTRSAARS